MANFSIRTLNFRYNGREYKLHLRTEQKHMEDVFERLCEKLETSGIDREYIGPFEITARRAR